jgi:ubiquinone/menaquinone biosynthesis C-methylase UbiE
MVSSSVVSADLIVGHGMAPQPDNEGVDPSRFDAERRHGLRPLAVAARGTLAVRVQPVDSARTSSWEEWGQVDPMWAIVTEEGKENGGWDLEEFFASGEASIDSLWAKASELGVPTQHRRALDFGCGMGRLTRALGRHADQVTGLDISPSMIGLAQEHNVGLSGLTFVVHEGSDLRAFDDESFDIVCSLLVLQHLPSEEAMLGYLREFLRVLTPGGLLILQLPDHIPAAAPATLRTHLRPRTRLGGTLHRLGVAPTFLYRHLGWKPEMTMRALSEAQVNDTVDQAGGRVAWASDDAVDASGVSNVFYLITR